ncbi:MAG TPA: aldo/keto reductase [Gaiellaceae bacterium]|jgi:aryl-alcohol dehydrogenase-like predicted oxidoreductase
MERRALGRSGFEVSRIILGCGNFGGIGSAPEFFGGGENDEEAAAIMDRAWELGIATFDTADAYGGGRSELAIGRWMASRGVRPALTTKTFNPMSAGADHGLAPERIGRQLESSLERLGVDRVDLYMTHEPDPDTPLSDTLAALDDLVAAGRIGAYGGSNVDGPVLGEARGRYAWVQDSYSLLERADEADVLPLCEAEGLGYTPFSPLAGGWLAGRYRRGETVPTGSRMALRPGPYAHLDREEVWRGLEAFRGRAAAYGVEMATLAFAWLLSDPRVTAVIVGPRRPEHLDPAVRALELGLSTAERAELASLFD